MKPSLLFIPDISGYTKFIQTTEVEHSQHVISELLEVLIEANSQDLKLAEIEGDALFFYKEGEIPSQENLLAQIEQMFVAFYSHLKMLEKNRICPCNACATAPNLQLKIVAHSGELQHIEVHGNRKPFGEQVIEAHRLLKNSVASDNYVLISRDLATTIELSKYYYSKAFRFEQGKDTYDGKEVNYIYSIIDTAKLTLKPFSNPKKVELSFAPQVVLHKNFEVSAEILIEYITNYSHRHHWVKDAEEFKYNEHEVTRLGTEHVCVVNGKHLDFITITKKVQAGQLIYGELTTSPPPVDKLYNFFIVTPKGADSCELTLEIYAEAKSIFKKAIIQLFAKKSLRKGMTKALNDLEILTREPIS